MANDLLALLNHLDVDRGHIVGHSFGARVALHFTISHSQRVRTLTIADTQISCLQDQVRLADWPHWKTWKRQLQQQGFESLPAEHEPINFQMLAHFNQLSGDFTHGALNRPRARPSLKRRDMGQRGASRWEKLMSMTSARQAFADDRHITVEGMRRIDVPTLALFGEYSHCLASCEKLNRYIRTCKVKIMPEVGHFFPAIKPRLFSHILHQYLKQQASANIESRSLQLEQHPIKDLRNLSNSVQFPLRDSSGELVLFDRRKSSVEDRRHVSNA
jgi:pimeloyl-ACP methyl ester carboxylesterase